MFLTASLSAVLGMAGGIALLGVLLFFLPPLVAIPLHGVIQLVSNGSRVIVQRRHARFGLIGWYALLLLPAGAVGLSLAQSLPEPLLEGAIGVCVLVATWLPRRGGGESKEVRDVSPRRRMLVLGGVSGFLQMVLGAIGPLIDPFFLGLGLSRQALVGTKAACQALAHAAKIALFGAAGFAFSEHAPLLVAGSLCAVAGTFVGSRILDRLSERAFLALYRSVLTGLALRLLWTSLPA